MGFSDDYNIVALLGWGIFLISNQFLVLYFPPFF